MTTSLSYLWRSLRIDRQIEDEVKAWGGGDVTEESKNEITAGWPMLDLPRPEERMAPPAESPLWWLRSPE